MSGFTHTLGKRWSGHRSLMTPDLNDVDKSSLCEILKVQAWCMIKWGTSESEHSCLFHGDLPLKKEGEWGSSWSRNLMFFLNRKGTVRTWSHLDADGKDYASQGEIPKRGEWLEQYLSGGEEPTSVSAWVIGEKTELWAQRPEVR